MAISCDTRAGDTPSRAAASFLSMAAINPETLKSFWEALSLGFLGPLGPALGGGQTQDPETGGGLPDGVCLGLLLPDVVNGWLEA